MNNDKVNSLSLSHYATTFLTTLTVNVLFHNKHTETFQKLSPLDPLYRPFFRSKETFAWTIQLYFVLMYSDNDHG